MKAKIDLMPVKFMQNFTRQADAELLITVSADVIGGSRMADAFTGRQTEAVAQWVKLGHSDAVG